MTNQNINFKKEFNNRVRDEVWIKHHQSFTQYFFYALTRLKQIDNYYIPNNLLPPNVLESRIYRLELGYHGIGKPVGIPSKIMSKESSLLKAKDCVNDHVLGATETGKYIQCHGCRHPLSLKDTKSKDYTKGVSCSYCIQFRTEEQKQNSLIRQKQIANAEMRQENHPFKKILSRADVTISSSRESYSTKSINDIKLKEFTLINSPASLKLLTLPSLSGISGLIENEEGINFLKGEVKYIEDTDYFTDIEMYGVSDSIGLVMDGSINRRDRTLDFVGEISPIHLINMLLKKVPIIGDLLVGNEGEGLFAFEFEMRGDASDPDVISNPLSIAKPQILERASEYLGAID